MIFLYPARTADSLFAYVLVPTYRSGKIIGICAYIKNYPEEFSFHVLTSHLCPSLRLEDGFQFNIII